MISGRMASQSGPPNVISLCERRSSAGLGDDVHFSGEAAEIVKVMKQHHAEVKEMHAEELRQRDEHHAEQLEMQRAIYAKEMQRCAVQAAAVATEGRTASSRAVLVSAGLAAMFFAGRALR